MAKPVDRNRRVLKGDTAGIENAPFIVFYR